MTRALQEVPMLFIGKDGDAGSTRAEEFVLNHRSDATIIRSSRGMAFPEEQLRQWEGDFIVSYLSQWILPEWLLEKATSAAINFHPAPPEYPGIGTLNFALYDGATTFGVTCHEMIAKVDAGPFVAVKRFPVLPEDTAWTLNQRAYAYLQTLFYEVMTPVLTEGKLVATAAPSERWSERKTTRKQLDALCRLTPDMSDEEQRRRIRATHYPGAPGPYMIIGGQIFVLEGGKAPPIARKDAKRAQAADKDAS